MARKRSKRKVESPRRVHAAGLDDVQDQLRIHEAKPRGNAVVDWARRCRGKGLQLRTKPDGSFTITIKEGPEGLKRKQEWMEMNQATRRAGFERSEKVKARRELVEVRDRRGRLLRVNAQNEQGLGARGLIQAPAMTLTPPLGLPRCQLTDPEQHDYRDASDGRRCGWCGRRE